MGLVQGPVGCTERSTLQVSKRIGLYPHVRVEGGGSRAVSQAGAVLLVETLRKSNSPWLNSPDPCGGAGRH